MRSITTYALTVETSPETLGAFEDSCIADVNEDGFKVVRCMARYATPDTITLLPSEVLLAAIDAGAGIAVAFIDYELPEGT